MSNEERERMGERIALARKEQGWTQAELARRLELKSGPRAIRNIENARTDVPVPQFEQNLASVASSLPQVVQYIASKSSCNPPAVATGERRFVGACATASALPALW